MTVAVALLVFFVTVGVTLLAVGFVRAATLYERFLVWALTEDPVNKLSVCVEPGFPSLDAMVKASPSHLQSRCDAAASTGTLRIVRAPPAGLPLLTTLPERELLLCLASPLTTPAQHVKDIGAGGKAFTVYHVDDLHRFRMAAVLRSFGVGQDAVTWKRVPTQQESLPDFAGLLDAISKDTTPCTGVIVAPLSVSKALLRQQPAGGLRALSYDGIDVHRLRVMLPHAVYEVVDVRDVLPQQYERAELRSLLAFDVFLAADSSSSLRDTDFDFVAHYGRVLDAVGETGIARNNYYSKYFAFHPVTEARMRAFDAGKRRTFATDFRISEGTREGTRETFAAPQPDQPPVRLRFAGGMPPGAWMTPAQGAPAGVWTLALPSVSAATKAAGGVKLRVGDRVDIPGGEDTLPRFEWYVTSVTPSTVLTSHWRVFGRRNDTATLLLPGSLVWLVDEGVLATVEKTDGDKVIIAEPPKQKPPPGMCVNKPWIRTETECTAARSAMDRLGAGTWDTPCKEHTDCPFFQANRRYRNYRGGCIAGYCEMPVGVTRMGYRKHAGEAYCHGCDDDPVACCTRQGDMPNYAFPLDQVERRDTSAQAHL